MRAPPHENNTADKPVAAPYRERSAERAYIGEHDAVVALVIVEQKKNFGKRRRYVFRFKHARRICRRVHNLDKFVLRENIRYTPAELGRSKPHGFDEFSVVVKREIYGLNIDNSPIFVVAVHIAAVAQCDNVLLGYATFFIERNGQIAHFAH